MHTRACVWFLLSLCALLLSIAAPATAQPLQIIAFGDSLTAGYGLDAPDSFPKQLERHLQQQGLDVVVQNAGVSGDTSSGGLSRLDWAVPDNLPKGPAALVILELGANDGLRGVEPSVTKQNLAAILEKLQAKDIPILFTGMRAPPNLGADYAQEFDQLFPALAERFRVPFYPFFLEGVAANPDLNQPDGIHPNADGVAEIVARITPFILQALNLP